MYIEVKIFILHIRNLIGREIQSSAFIQEI